MTKTVKVSYSFYKKYFRNCKTGEYDPKRKTIEIEVPERPKFPKDWKSDGIHHYTPEGIEVVTYGSGYSESYNVIVAYDLHPEAEIPCIREKLKTVYPSIHARQDVLAVVSELAKIPNIRHSIFEPRN